MAKSRKPQVVQNEIVARTLAGQSKSRIARDMDIHRATVRNVLKVSNIDQLLVDSRAYCAREVVPDAIESMHAQIKDRTSSGDGHLGLRFLEKVGVLNRGAAPQTMVVDARTQIAIDTLLPPPRPDRTVRRVAEGLAPSPANSLGSGVEPAPAPALPESSAPAPREEAMDEWLERHRRAYPYLPDANAKVDVASDQAKPAPASGEPAHTDQASVKKLREDDDFCRSSWF